MRYLRATCVPLVLPTYLCKYIGKYDVSSISDVLRTSFAFSKTKRTQKSEERRTHEKIFPVLASFRESPIPPVPVPPVCVPVPTYLSSMVPVKAQLGTASPQPTLSESEPHFKPLRERNISIQTKKQPKRSLRGNLLSLQSVDLSNLRMVDTIPQWLYHPPTA
jgi:hypothetical protein